LQAQQLAKDLNRLET